MAEVIRPLSLEVAALAASQQQQQLALETLQTKLTERGEATEKALLEASESKAAALRATQEEHRQASMAAHEQHERALAVVQTQLVEREAATERALLENERLQEAVAAAKLRAGEAELRAGEMERRAGAAEAGASEARAALALAAAKPPYAPEAAPKPPCAPGAAPHAEPCSAAGDVLDGLGVLDGGGGGSTSSTSSLDVEGMWHDAEGMEDLQDIQDLDGMEGMEGMEGVAGLDDMEHLQKGAAWHEAEEGGGAGCDVDGAVDGVGGGGGEWYQDAEGMWHEEDLQELQAAGLAQLAEETLDKGPLTLEARQHERAQVDERGSGKRARLAQSGREEQGGWNSSS